MKDLRIPLRVVLYDDEGRWIAHCLEFDLLGDGVTKRDAFESLFEAIHLQVEESLRHDNPRNLFSPASGEVFEAFAAGADSESSECDFKINSLSISPIVIESVQVREFCSTPTPTIV